MSDQDRKDRLNAVGQGVTGGAMVGAGMAANAGMDHALERKGLKTPGKALWAAARGKPGGKLSALHAAHTAARVASRGVQAAGLPLLAYGSYNAAQPGGTVARVRFKDDVLRSTIDHTTGRADVRRAKRQLKANRELRSAQRRAAMYNTQAGVAKYLASDDRARLVRRKRVGRDLSLVGGTIGASALALRAPEAARGLLKIKALRGSKPLSRVVSHEPGATKASNALLAIGAGTGAAGAFNYASQQKLESKGIKKSFVTGVGWKPITRMTRGEVDALRSARSSIRQGGRGHLGQLIGGPGNTRVTAADGVAEARMQARINANRAILAEASKPDSGWTVGQRKVRGGSMTTLHPAVPDAKPLPGSGGSHWSPLGGSTRNKGLAVVDPRTSPRIDPKDIARHELAHGSVRNPIRASMRRRADGRVWMGDEARATMAQRNPVNGYTTASSAPKRGFLRRKTADTSRSRFTTAYGDRFSSDQGGVDAGLKRFSEVKAKIEQARVGKAVSDADYRRYQTKGERRSTRAQVVGGAGVLAGTAFAAPALVRSGFRDSIRGAAMVNDPAQRGNFRAPRLDSKPDRDRVIKPNRQGVYDITGKPEPKPKPYAPPGVKMMRRGGRKIAGGLLLSVAAPAAVIGNNVRVAQRNQNRVADRKLSAIGKADKRGDLVEAGAGAGLLAAGVRGNTYFDAARDKANALIDNKHRATVAQHRQVSIPVGTLPIDDMGRPTKGVNSKGASYFGTAPSNYKQRTKAERKAAAGRINAANEVRNGRLKMVRRATGFKPRAAVMGAAMVGGTGLLWHGARTGLEKADRHDVDAAMVGGIVGTGGYHGALYATKPIDRRIERQFAQEPPQVKAILANHKRAMGITGTEPMGDTRWLKYHRQYPKSLPGWKWKRTMSHLQGGRSGVVLSGAAGMATAAAAVGGNRRVRDHFKKAAPIRVNVDMPPLWAAVMGLEF